MNLFDIVCGRFPLNSVFVNFLKNQTGYKQLLSAIEFEVHDSLLEDEVARDMGS